MWISIRIRSDPDSFESRGIELKVFSTETAVRQPEEQTEGGHHRRHSPDGS